MHAGAFISQHDQHDSYAARPPSFSRKHIQPAAKFCWLRLKGPVEISDVHQKKLLLIC